MFRRSSVVLVDTPGFGDTGKSDLEILAMISEWLGKDPCFQLFFTFTAYQTTILVGTPLKDLQVSQELCGRHDLSRVILVTTMWDQVEHEVGEERLRELKNGYWKAMRLRGATTFKHLNNQESAIQLITWIHSAQVRLQLEISDSIKSGLSETAAGWELCFHLEELAERELELRRAIQAETEGANQKTAEDLGKEYAEVKAQLESTLTQARAWTLIELKRRFRKSIR
ncbi:hypothetical protein F5J12DRAFT_845460 [Pisolithus orientalis]|uniref:uncharacterized protein n=1 Tax=Pisolithus orientalis TaxID=936130 RepID=UPI0022246572|nr:uncharacterized protein F5J12DRAFT_845460 [Pisolithus orientalis]KAI6000343.1 hypothetical protein F5J12DRAFT_845460 [Pisolithus orientalis]